MLTLSIIWLTSEPRRRSLGIEFLAPDMQFFQGKGCNQCNQGYRGRVGLHEVLTLNDRLRDAISQGVGVMQLQAIAREQGMTTLLDDAREKINQGLTTIDEVLRLLGPQDLQE